MPLCLYGSVSLCLWDERCSRDLWLYVGRTSGISPSKVPNRTDVSFFPGSQTDHQPNRDASESTAPGKLRKPKTFNTSCCVPILIYSTLIQALRKLQAFNNKCSAIFSPQSCTTILVSRWLSSSPFSGISNVDKNNFHCLHPNPPGWQFTCKVICSI